MRDAGDDDGVGQCTSPAECDDGDFCNGAETCQPGAAGADERGCAPATEDRCLPGQTCDPTEARCITECDVSGDADNDGYDSVDCGGDDCDDANAQRFPTNLELCDANHVDEDCDPATFGARDMDLDGYVSDTCCNHQGGAGSSLACGTDCDDAAMGVHPDQNEVCQGVDDDCDDSIDEDVLLTFYRDADGDGFGNASGQTAMACTPPVGFTGIENATDCNDTPGTGAAINPGNAELCNDVDDDCDTNTDENSVSGGSLKLLLYVDNDRDGYGEPGTQVLRCPMAGFSENGGDCNDNNANIRPGVADTCDGVDNNCNNMDDGCACSTGMSEACTGNSLGACDPGTRTCNASNQWGNCTGVIGPTAGEDCDNSDDNCDGQTDAMDPSADVWCATSGGLQHTVVANCLGATCQFVTCEGGWGSCDGNAGNGCETSLTTATHCGACGTPCNYANANESCSTGTCIFTGCAANYGNCDANIATNGCETPLNTLTNCGSCGTPCNFANASESCSTGTCTFTACSMGYANCDGNLASNGCETYIAGSNVNRCGSCNPCTSAPANGTPSCSGGVCGFTCNNGYAKNAAGTACVAIPAPRLVGPLSGSMGTSRRPTFQWANSGVATGAAIQVCRDRGCSNVVGTWNIPNAGFGQIGTPGYALTPGVYFWRAQGSVGTSVGTAWSTATWRFRVVARNQLPLDGGGTKTALELDIQNDGYGDLVVGNALANQVRYWHGSASGLPGTNPGTTLAGVTANRFGSSIAALGDVNGDGYGDFAVGACGPDAGATPTADSCANSVYVFHGAANGTPTLARTLTAPGGINGFGYSVTGGDVNADGWGDLVVGAYVSEVVYVYFGSAAGIASTIGRTINKPAGSGANPLFGVVVATIGDVDSDNDWDIAIGAPIGDHRVHILCGAPDGNVSICRTLQGPAMSNFGLSVGPAGDFNGDGIPDFVVGGNNSSGGAYLYLGIFGALPTSAARTWTTSRGITVFGGPDVNGDGFSDAVVGSSADTIVHVYLGTGGTLPTNPSVTIDSAVTDFGRTVGMLGDVNGDALGDVVVGACNPAGTCGNQVQVFHGGSPTMDANADFTRSITGGSLGWGVLR